MTEPKFYLSWRKKLHRGSKFLCKPEFESLRDAIIHKKVFLIGIKGNAVNRTPLDDWHILNELYLEAADDEINEELKSIKDIMLKTCIKFNDFTSASKQKLSEKFEDYEHIFNDPSKYPLDSFKWESAESLQEIQRISELNDEENIIITDPPTNSLCSSLGFSADLSQTFTSSQLEDSQKEDITNTNLSNNNNDQIIEVDNTHNTSLDNHENVGQRVQIDRNGEDNPNLHISNHSSSSQHQIKTVSSIPNLTQNQQNTNIFIQPLPANSRQDLINDDDLFYLHNFHFLHLENGPIVSPEDEFLNRSALIISFLKKREEIHSNDGESSAVVWKSVISHEFMEAIFYAKIRIELDILPIIKYLFGISPQAKFDFICNTIQTVFSSVTSQQLLKTGFINKSGHRLKVYHSPLLNEPFKGIRLTKKRKEVQFDLHQSPIGPSQDPLLSSYHLPSIHNPPSQKRSRPSTGPRFITRIYNHTDPPNTNSSTNSNTSSFDINTNSSNHPFSDGIHQVARDQNPHINTVNTMFGVQSKGIVSAAIDVNEKKEIVLRMTNATKSRDESTETRELVKIINSNTNRDAVNELEAFKSLITGNSSSKQTKNKHDAILDEITMMILNLFNFKKYQFTQFMFDVIKYINSNHIGYDRKSKSTYLKSVFCKKFNLYRFNTVIEEHINHIQSFIISTQNPLNSYAIKIDRYCLKFLNDARFDLNDYVKTIKPYINDSNISELSFWEYINSIYAHSYTERAFVSYLCKAPYLIDQMKANNNTDLNYFLSSNFDDFAISDLQSNKNQNTKFNAKSYNNYNSSNKFKSNNNYNKSHNHYHSYKPRKYHNNKHSKDTKKVSFVTRAYNKVTRLAKKVGKQEFPRTHCVFYNNENQCKKEDCNRKHLCVACNGKHPITSCQAVLDAQEQESDDDDIP